MESKHHLVFVYGTLREGESNHELMTKAELLGSHETLPIFSLNDLGDYPGLVEGHMSIIGEVYRVSNETLKQLDILEDVGVEYRREQMETPFGIAWYYIYQGQVPGNAIHSGDWIKR